MKADRVMRSRARPASSPIPFRGRSNAASALRFSGNGRISTTLTACVNLTGTGRMPAPPREPLNILKNTRGLSMRRYDYDIIILGGGGAGDEQTMQNKLTRALPLAIVIVMTGCPKMPIIGLRDVNFLLCPGMRNSGQTCSGSSMMLSSLFTAGAR